MSKNDFTALRIIRTCMVLPFFFILWACAENISDSTKNNRDLVITPDYSGLTIPCNIAPLNFMVNGADGCPMVAVYKIDNKELFRVTSGNGSIVVPKQKWTKLLKEAKGVSFSIDVFVKESGKWLQYNSLRNTISNDSIDGHLVYRLIRPGFETWDKMGIYQRDLASFDETPIMENTLSGNNCMNCHSFCKNNNDLMLFHMRAANAGTYIYDHGVLEKFDTSTDSTLGAGVYPSWHPGGKYVAFSTNRIIQTFHAIPDKKIEVLDTLSDIIICDRKARTIRTAKAMATKERFETFPSWSPDGKSLFFCSAKAVSPRDYANIRYDLLRIGFDPENETFGQVDTIVRAASIGKSVSFPRVSPDGKYLMFCLSNYGNFSIWHSESDLYLCTLETGEIKKIDVLNSCQTESYHTWSSSGRWVVFSSRRVDGLYTKPYFAHFDEKGNFSKPFLLPQKDPQYYDYFMKSYNIPELVKSKVKLGPRAIVEKMSSKPHKIKYLPEKKQ